MSPDQLSSAGLNSAMNLPASTPSMVGAERDGRGRSCPAQFTHWPVESSVRKRRTVSSVCLIVSALLNSQSHTTSASQPISFSCINAATSLSTFRLNFGSQYLVFDQGVLPSAHFSCWCQKQPWTKITSRRLEKTRSGFPGRSFP